jgi:phosphoribosylglycinamide formyltransferase-1
VSNRTINLVVLISGGGTNLQSIMDSIREGALDARIAAVISDQPDVYGLTRAREAGVRNLVIQRESFESKIEYETELMNIVASHSPDLVVLAGFMRILGPQFVARFLGRLINIHPSLLPKYKGLHTHERVVAAGDKVHGATVHFVTPELDDGPIIIQSRIDVNPDDTAQILQQKVLREEHKIYPRAIQWIAEDKVSYETSSPDYD